MSDRPFPSHSFHGSNSSSSKDNGSGSRNYHVPNHATSYANDKSKLISVKFEEDKGVTKAMIAVVTIFLLFAALPVCLTVLRFGTTAAKTSFMTSNVRDHASSVAIQTGTEISTRQNHHESQDQQAEKAVNKDIILQAPGPHWDKPVPGAQCHAFGTREYTARLWGLPFFSSWTKSCKNTGITIHNVLIKHPSYCESKWPFGGIIGHWVVDFDEQDCIGRWGKITDKGCIKEGSTARRFQSRLWDIKSRQDWMRICTSAPAIIHNVLVPKPTFCEDRGLWGVYGVWDLEDPSCE